MILERSEGSIVQNACSQGSRRRLAECLRASYPGDTKAAHGSLHQIESFQPWPERIELEKRSREHPQLDRRRDVASGAKGSRNSKIQSMRMTAACIQNPFVILALPNSQSQAKTTLLAPTSRHFTLRRINLTSDK